MADPIFVADQQQAPTVSPSGLYAVAAPVEVDRPVIYGVDVRAEALGGHGLWGAPVCTPGDRRKQGGESEVSVHFPGTAIWAAEECAAVGLSDVEAKANARRRLLAVESSDAEVFTAGVLADRAVPTTVGLSEAEAVFRAEGIVPVLHVRPSDVPGLLQAKALVSISGSIRTLLGSPVAIGAGYQTGFPDGAAYLTGPVTIYRNSVDVYDTFDQTTNQRLAIAERAMSVTWTGQTLALNLQEGEG